MKPNKCFRMIVITIMPEPFFVYPDVQVSFGGCCSIVINRLFVKQIAKRIGYFRTVKFRPIFLLLIKNAVSVSKPSDIVMMINFFCKKVIQKP